MNQVLNNPNWEFAGIFYDFGKSGLRKRGRTGLEKMLKQAGGRGGRLHTHQIGKQSVERHVRNSKYSQIFKGKGYFHAF